MVLVILNFRQKTHVNKNRISVISLSSVKCSRKGEMNTKIFTIFFYEMLSI